MGNIIIYDCEYILYYHGRKRVEVRCTMCAWGIKECNRHYINRIRWYQMVLSPKFKRTPS